MQSTNFYVDKFSKQQGWNKYPRGNNTKVPEVWENFSQTSFGGEFWVCDVIMHETYGFGFGFGFTTVWDWLSRHSIENNSMKARKIKDSHCLWYLKIIYGSCHLERIFRCHSYKRKSLINRMCALSRNQK